MNSSLRGEELTNLLRTNHITLLNTWAVRQEAARTSRFGKHSAQLDYVMVRQKDANQQARQAQPIRNCPLGAWRHAGGHHLPLQASIRKRIPPPRRQEIPMQRIDRERIIACAHKPHSADNAALVQQFRTGVQRALDQDVSVQDLGNIAGEIAKVAAIITNMWKQWVLIKRTSCGRGLQSIFRRWKVWAAYFRQYRTYKKQCQERKKQYLRDKMAEAEIASRKHDLRGVYNIVRSLAPKAPRRRTQLKGNEGNLLSRTEEAMLFCARFKQKFTSTDAWRFDATLLYDSSETRDRSELQLVDEAQLQQDLLKAPLRKAVPPGHPPSATWRLCADLAATTIATALNGSWTSGPISVPQGWSDAHLVLIKKPGKTGRDPNHHRPIGLQDQLGKITFKQAPVPMVGGLQITVDLAALRARLMQCPDNTY